MEFFFFFRGKNKWSLIVLFCNVFFFFFKEVLRAICELRMEKPNDESYKELTV